MCGNQCRSQMRFVQVSFFTLGCMVAGIIPFIIVYMILMGSLQQQTPKYVQQTPSIDQVVPDQNQDAQQQ